MCNGKLPADHPLNQAYAKDQSNPTPPVSAVGREEAQRRATSSNTFKAVQGLMIQQMNQQKAGLGIPQG